MQKPSVSTSIPVIIIISIIAGGLYFLFRPQNDTSGEQHPKPLATHKIAKEINTEPDPQAVKLTPNDQPQPSSENYRQAPMEITSTDPCLKTIKQLDSFFIYLDSQDYIQEYQFPTGSKDFIASMVNKALNYPPAYDVKKDSISNIQTGAHLYHVIGRQNLLILAKILINEPDQLENIFANFYNWSLINGQCPNRTYTIRPQLNQLYEYACFFIDSKDGGNYINRRDTVTGLLTRFYAIRIIEEAQAHHIDKYTMELAAPIASLITDIESSDLLAQKTAYLKTLYSYRDRQ